MRPAHYAREVTAARGGSYLYVHSFNEARALCAGSCATNMPCKHNDSRFNEARALCAGSFPRAGPIHVGLMFASMRPAHYAREVRVREDEYAAIVGLQ